MKKEIEAAPVCVFRDEKHEQKTKQELEAAKLLMQQLLDEWHNLKIGDVSDINELLMRPERVYKSAIDRLVTPPNFGGKFTINKAKFLEGLELPDPARLYMTAKATRQQPFCASSELWSVTENKVVLDETEGGALIDSQSIYASTPDKIEAVETVLQFCDKANKLNEIIGGQLLPPAPYINQFIMGKFLLTQKSYPGPYEMSPDPEFLRFLIQK